MTKHWKPGDRIELDMPFVANETLADLPDGYIAGIASTPSTDLYGHKVLAGAFDKSITKKGLAGPRGIKLLASHNWEKPAGTIKKLKTIGDELKIEAQLNLNVSYVRDLHEIAKQNGGLNFSVGFTLEEFSFVDGDKSEDGEYLIIKQGDLMEVSVVVFPAQLEATMDFIKSHETMSELEKALVAKEFCRSRNEAQRLGKYLKANEHLFLDRPLPSAGSVKSPTHPLLDVVPQLRAATDLVALAKAVLRP
ncbi:HK97 family phage prohead protease [Bradyrhizobium elkanii]|uniref:HK97 family phage prohead protease n=1 Tax=Bradyrhizobium elkanii TaxID=29448 RepID=UPI0004AF78DD|nr:HK97 family phage prohead protease [Bradyrhizobium elkanii]WLA79587.1 HK97 family phage prohead protease [Bradyrhizobium elkanii]